MSRVYSYYRLAGECQRLATTAFSAYDRRNLSKMAADWCALADVAAKHEGKAERMRPLPEPEPAPEPVAAEPKKPRKRWPAREQTGLKVSVLRAHSTRAAKTRT